MTVIPELPEVVEVTTGSDNVVVVTETNVESTVIVEEHYDTVFESGTDVGPEVVEVVSSGPRGPTGPQGEQGPPGEFGGQIELAEHILDETPHPVYDDGPSFALLYQNAKV